MNDVNRPSKELCDEQFNELTDALHESHHGPLAYIRCEMERLQTELGETNEALVACQAQAGGEIERLRGVMRALVSTPSVIAVMNPSRQPHIGKCNCPFCQAQALLDGTVETTVSPRKSMSDERLTALIKYGPAWGQWASDEITKALTDLQRARVILEAALHFRQDDELEVEIRTLLYGEQTTVSPAETDVQRVTCPDCGDWVMSPTKPGEPPRCACNS